MTEISDQHLTYDITDITVDTVTFWPLRQGDNDSLMHLRNIYVTFSMAGNQTLPELVLDRIYV